MWMPDEANHERGPHGRGTIMRVLRAMGEAYRARSSLAQRDIPMARWTSTRSLMSKGTLYCRVSASSQNLKTMACSISNFADCLSAATMTPKRYRILTWSVISLVRLAISTNCLISHSPVAKRRIVVCGVQL